MAVVEAVGASLAAYLGTDVRDFRILASGWETTVFEFSQARRCSRLKEALPGHPLVLRFYEGTNAHDKATREAHTMEMLASTGYPVPQLHLFEPDPELLGAPFLVMERVTGDPLFSTTSFPRAFKTFSLGFFDFVRAQVRLHRLALPINRTGWVPHGGSTSREVPEPRLLERILRIIAKRIDDGPLPSLRAAHARLHEEADRFQEAADALVHLDYHPQNVIVRNFRVTGVIDWVSADHGDRHLCAATTSVILATSAMEHPRWMRDNPVGNSLRRLFRALYLPVYHALAPVDLARLRYCQAVAAVARLSMFGLMRTRGAEAAGFRKEAITHVTPAVVRLLSRYASRKVGIPVSIPDGN